MYYKARLDNVTVINYTHTHDNLGLQSVHFIELWNNKLCFKNLVMLD